MARARRVRVAGLSQHITQRGNNRIEIFRTDRDCLVFLAMLGRASERYESAIHGYALMKTHVHLLVTPCTPAAVEKTMQVVGARYAGYFNKRYKRTGALFEGRYRSTLIDDERYWINCLRYIELNPVRAGFVRVAEEYRWSSYKGNANGVIDRLLTPHQWYLALGSSVSTRQETWRAMCAHDLSADELDQIRFAALERRISEGPLEVAD